MLVAGSPVAPDASNWHSNFRKECLSGGRRRQRELRVVHEAAVEPARAALGEDHRQHVEWFRVRSNVVMVHGERSIDAVFEEIEQALEQAAVA